MKRRQLLLSNIFLGLILLSGCDTQRDTNVFEFIPILKNYKIDSIQAQEVFADPSYLRPYNVYIRLKIKNRSDGIRIIDELHLKRKTDINDSTLRKMDDSASRQMTIFPGSKRFFTMKSLNVERVVSVSEKQHDISWWDEKKFSKLAVYAGSYYDSGRVKTISNYLNRGNGKVSCCIDDRYVYFLIECWDL